MRLTRGCSRSRSGGTLMPDATQPAGGNVISVLADVVVRASVSDEQRFSVTVFPDLSGSRCRQELHTTESLANLMFTKRRSKGACELLKLAQFGPERTDKGSLRHDGNVASINGVEVDYDGGEISFADAESRLARLNIECIIYTSPSHTPERPRWRVLCPTAEPITPSVRSHLCDRLNGVFDGKLASESWVLSQAFYFGNAAPAHFRCVVVQGAPIDFCAFEGIEPIPGRKPTRRPGNGAKNGSSGKVSGWLNAINGQSGWHNAIRDLVARKVALGEPDEEIMLIAPGVCWEGFTVEQTRDEIQEFIDSARAKGYGSGRVANSASIESVRDHSSAIEPEDNQPDPELPHLPDVFWEVHPTFQQIREYAYYHGVSAEALLTGSLTRLAATMPHTVELMSRRQPARCNLISGFLGTTGTGKSYIGNPARCIVPKVDGMADDKPIGTGEGIAELFMDKIVVGEGKNKQTKRIQARHNAFIFCDEGTTLKKLGARDNSIITEALLTAFSGGTLGQSNASDETTRIVRDYCFGAIFNFTYEAFDTIREMVESGFPGRFLYAMTIDPNIPPPKDRPSFYKPPVIIIDRTPGGVILFDKDGLFDEVNHELWLRATGRKVVEPIDGHSLFIQCKVVGLFTYVVFRERSVRMDYWDLAGMLCDYSRASRLYGERKAAELTHAKEAADNAKCATRSRIMSVAAKNADKVVDGLARRIARKVHDKGGMKNREVTQSLSGAERALQNEAIVLAEALDWVVVQDSGLVPGKARPA